jgi:uroporphyrinogen decarboxylase
MSPKERFLTALKLGKPDRVPIFDFPWNSEIFRETLDIEPTVAAKKIFAVALILGFDSVYIEPQSASTYKKEFIRENIYLNEWGVPSKISPVSFPVDVPVEFIVKNKSDLKKIKPPDPNRPERYEEMAKVLEMNKNRLAVAGFAAGPLIHTWFLHGPDRIFLNIYDNPKLLKEIFKISNNFWIPCGINQIDTGIDCIWIGEDLGYSSGPFFSLKVFRELVYPFLKEMVDEFKKVKKGIPIIFHSCGNFKIFIEDIIDLGISGINPFQRTAGWDIAEIKEKYGNRICIVGNIDSSRTLPYGSIGKVKKEVKETIEIAGKNGGFIISSDHSLHDGIPMKNIWAMIDAAMEYGKY